MDSCRLATCALIFAAGVRCDAQALPEAKTQSITVNSTLVLVPTLVRYKAGNVVFTLKADDFTLTDDGVPQKITLQPETDAEPLALVVLMEAGAANQITGWHSNKREETENRFHTLPTLIDAIAGNVPRKVAVVGFDSKPELLEKFSTNMDAVAATIDGYSDENAGDHGAAIRDAVIYASELLGRQPPEFRRAILLLSETNDRGSLRPLADALRAVTMSNTTIYSVAYSTAHAEVSEYGAKNLPTKIVPRPKTDPVVTAAAKSGMPISMGVFVLEGIMNGLTLENSTPNPAGGCLAKDPAAEANVPEPSKASKAYDCVAQALPPLALARMAAIAAVDGLKQNVPETVAKLTGGEYFSFNSDRGLENALLTIANHVPNRYVLSFRPQAPHAGPHALSVKLKDYDFTVSARSTYWADPAPSK